MNVHYKDYLRQWRLRGIYLIAPVMQHIILLVKKGCHRLTTFTADTYFLLLLHAATASVRTHTGGKSCFSQKSVIAIISDILLHGAYRVAPFISSFQEHFLVGYFGGPMFCSCQKYHTLSRSEVMVMVDCSPSCEAGDAG
jgi:hypothetical protein